MDEVFWTEGSSAMIGFRHPQVPTDIVKRGAVLQLSACIWRFALTYMSLYGGFRTSSLVTKPSELSLRVLSKAPGVVGKSGEPVCPAT